MAALWSNFLFKTKHKLFSVAVLIKETVLQADGHTLMSKWLFKLPVFLLAHSLAVAGIIKNNSIAKAQGYIHIS